MHEQSSQLATTAAAVSEPPRHRAEVVERLESTRRDYRTFLLFRCLFGVALLLLLACGLLAVGDWMWILSGMFRAITLGLVGLLTLVLIFRLAVMPWRQFTRQDAAAEIETTFPDLGQRVRTTLEYAEPTPATLRAWPSLVRALTQDTDQRTHRLELRDVIPWRIVRWLMVGTVGLVCVHVMILVASHEMRIAAKRLFLVPIHYTRLTVAPGDHTVNAGDNLTIQATVAGRAVSKLQLLYRQASREDNWTPVSFGPPESAPGELQRLIGVFGTALRNCEENLQYRVVADSVESDVYLLNVLHPLKLDEFEATVDPPPYTRQPSTVVREPDFRVIEGSRVSFRFTLDRAPRTAQLRLASTGSEGDPVEDRTRQIPLDINNNVLAGALASVNEELQYEIKAEASDGMQLDAGTFQILIEPDRRPLIRFVKPPAQIEVTPTTEIRMRVEANDDFGTAKVGIVYQIGDGPKETLYLEENPEQPMSLTAAAALYLEKHRLNYQDGLTYFAFVEDNYPAKSHRAVTELQFIDIRPYKREYQLLKSGQGASQKPGGT